MNIVRPLDGKYVNSDEVIAAACAKADHPALYLNLSLSGKLGRDIHQCVCGVYDEGRDAEREHRKAQRAARKAKLAKSDPLAPSGGRE